MPTIHVPAGQLDIKGPQAATGVDRWLQSGSLAFAGLALTCAISVGMPVGAVAYTGHAPTVTATTNAGTIAIPAGSLQFKGPQRPPLSIPAGSLVFTGRTTGLASPFGVGPITFTGYAPTLDVTTGTTINLPAGSLAFQGLIQTVRAGDLAPEIPAGSLVFKGPARPEARPQPPAGVLAFTGRVPQVLVDSPGSAISIPAGEIAFTGHAPERLNDFSIAVPAGTLNLSGQYIRVAFKTLDCGSLVWQGLAPTVSTSTALIPIPVGTLRHTGLAPTAHLSVAIPAGSIAFTAGTWSAVNTGAITIPAGQLVLTGTQTTAHLVWTIPAGTLTLTGQTPVVDRGSLIPAGAIGYTGYALEMVSGDRIIAIPVGRLQFQGYAVELIRPVPAVSELFGRGSFNKRMRGKGSATTNLRGRGGL